MEAKNGVISLSCIEERLQRADPCVLAFDIETTKLPLKFPDALFDRVMMISYMIDGDGFLITNREIVSEDIDNFSYMPKPEYHGSFIVYNEPDERGVIERFFNHIKMAKPTVIATYNGDFFDWPFIETRASMMGIDMYAEIGFRRNSEDIYQSNHCAHMDCFAWVNRDSYLPQGSRGLKAVTVAKLGYDPDELDPELMTQYASEHPQTLSEYSVSDALATYYLYMKYVHPFIFSLCTIIPLGPDDVLRKGTGTLCEMLLMVQAYKHEIILPNKHKSPKESFWDGHLLDSETYVGGHVESIEAGIFRSDIPVNFAVDATAIDELINDLDAALKFSITVEEKKSLDDITDYEEVKAKVIEKLRNIKETPNRTEKPFIYHLDVASMYPNIMTTNRLQPDSMIQESDCAACDFNRPGKTCDRRMPWSWRGEYLPAKRDEYNMIRRAVANEKFPAKKKNGRMRKFEELSLDEQADLVKDRLQEYSKKVYHKVRDNKTIEREAIICQRENPFYVNTVRDFRDRRYDFKGKQKEWKGKTDALKSSGATPAEVDEAQKMIILYDSLQLAHKVILNSFYGYVMRKGSRWYSMEMAGVTCLTGARIIQMARELVERIGRPLELDTDGIWCMLPGSFPENIIFTLKNGKKMPISYPCVMLNHLVHARFTNHQYQTLVNPVTFKYETHSDNSIFFEVDGPYRAMILPTSKEEDKNLKKRYAVFNHDGSLAELKGFEVKRRGELQLIKIFQTQIFNFFLEGTTLVETYASVAKVANKWLDVLYEHGATLSDEELIDLVCENRSMSKTLEEYGNQKSTSITTAKRLAEFLGEQMIKDKGLNCKYIISARPKNLPVTERAIPVTIFSAEDSIKEYFLRKWLKGDPGDMDPRTIIDWDYYIERLGSVVQKLVTIPAALQRIPNPVPRIAHPDWLQRRINIKDDKFKQKKLTDTFSKQPLSNVPTNILDNRLPSAGDIEDMLAQPAYKLKESHSNKTGIKRKTAGVPPSSALDPYATLPSTMPSITEDYEGWLKYQKQKWKIQKQARIRRRQLFGEKPSVTSDKLGKFFRNQAELLYVDTWQILQLRETEMPGVVRAFVLIDQQIQPLTIRVQRQLFVNFKGDEFPDVEIEGCSVDKVNHTLPNGHPSAYLFKLTMSEHTYWNATEEMSIIRHHPCVEGIYENKIPLSVRAILKLGSLCTFDDSQRGVLGEGLEHGFDLSTLLHSSTKKPYLVDSPLGYIFIYHIVAREKQIFALFSTAKDEAHVIVLNRTRDPEPLPNIDKIYLDFLSRKRQNSSDKPGNQLFDYQEKIHFKVTPVTTRRRAHLAVNDTLKKFKKEASQPMVLALKSPRKTQLCYEIPFFNEFPILTFKSDPRDNDLPPLGWQAFIAKQLVTQYLALGDWIGHLIGLARYGNVPLCNLERDDPKYLIDITYARRLQANNIILWWSEDPLPDHAGYEKYDIPSSVDKVEMPSINNPGAYSSVCIDINIRNLSINTILSSSLFTEGNDSALVNPAAPDSENMSDGTGVLYSENAFASASVFILRDMVKSLRSESRQGNSTADIMVQHLIRWIEDPSSSLYDPSLHHHIQIMAKKAFQQLMTDFKRVGSQVIFAGSTRLLLQTSKKEVGNAYSYSQYIIKSIKAKPMFHFLDLEITEYWDYLVWYDESNYGGRGCKEVVEAENQQLRTIMHWHLNRYLPEPMQSVFLDWVTEYVELMHSLKQPDLGLENSNSTPRLTQLPFNSLTTNHEDGKMTSVLAGSYSSALKRQISGLIKKHRAEHEHPELAPDYQFPVLPGIPYPPHYASDLRDPVLELVKCLMQVLSLSEFTAAETRELRRQLLELFEVEEFSSEAKFENLSASFKLQQLICDNCTAMRDLDICRDSKILPENACFGHDPITAPWRCATCGTEYNKLALEEKLIGQVRGLIVEWQSQELKCTKCGRSRVGEYTEYCFCSGSWVGSMDGESIQEQLRVTKSAARFYGLRMLESVIGRILDLTQIDMN